MASVHPVRWVARQASTGIAELPRNGAWVLSKMLGAPAGSSPSGALADRTRRATTAIGDALPGNHDSIETRLKRAESAVARAKELEQQALAEARDADARADTAKSAAADGKQRLRDAEREAKREVERRTDEVRREHERMIAEEHEKASRDAAEGLEQLAAEIRSRNEALRQEAEEAAERAQRSVDEAHEQMAVARQLAAEATEAAKQAAEHAAEQARAVAEKADRNVGAAESVLDDARSTEQVLAAEAAHAVQAEGEYDVPERLADRTKAELVTIAEPLEIHNAARMRKDQLVRSIQRASRAKTRV